MRISERNAVSFSKLNTTQNPIRCIVCGGTTAPRFRIPFSGSFVHYCECTLCHHLIAAEFGPSTNYAGQEYFADIDYGWEGRNTKILQIIRLMLRLPGVGLDKYSRVLDYGCGKGRLVKSLRQSGIDAYGFDPFLPEGESSAVYRDLSAARQALKVVDLVTLIEVIEHMHSPWNVMEQIREILRTDGYLLVSTGIFEPKRHDENWYYLNPRAGHVSIFSEPSLLRLADETGFVPVIRVNETIWLLQLRKHSKNSFLNSLYLATSRLRIRLKPTNLRRTLRN